MVTERGVPESESDSVALIPVPEKLPEMEAPAAELKAAPVPQAAAAPAGAADKRDMGRGSSDDDTSAFAAAMEHYNQHRYLEAEQRFDAIAAAGGQESRDAARFAALAAHERGGCAASLQRFELLGNRYARTDLGAEATLRAAKCHADLGNTDQARQAYQSLLASPKYGSEAQAGLDVLDGQMVATRKARSAPASTAPAEAAKATKSAPSPNTVSPGDEAK
jgi:TolA-binding protein